MLTPPSKKSTDPPWSDTSFPNSSPTSENVAWSEDAEEASLTIPQTSVQGLGEETEDLQAEIAVAGGSGRWRIGVGFLLAVAALVAVVIGARISGSDEDDSSSTVLPAAQEMEDDEPLAPAKPPKQVAPAPAPKATAPASLAPPKRKPAPRVKPKVKPKVKPSRATRGVKKGSSLADALRRAREIGEQTETE